MHARDPILASRLAPNKRLDSCFVLSTNLRELSFAYATVRSTATPEITLPRIRNRYVSPLGAVPQTSCANERSWLFPPMTTYSSGPSGWAMPKETRVVHSFMVVLRLTRHRYTALTRGPFFLFSGPSFPTYIHATRLICTRITLSSPPPGGRFLHSPLGRQVNHLESVPVASFTLSRRRRSGQSRCPRRWCGPGPVARAQRVPGVSCDRPEPADGPGPPRRIAAPHPRPGARTARL